MGKISSLVLGILGLAACHSAPLDPQTSDETAGGVTSASPDEPAPMTSGGVNGGADGGVDSAAAADAPLIADNGWISESSNPFGIHGAVFAHGDATTSETLTSAIEGSRWCIAGTAARIDIGCTIVPPARDCFETFFGGVLSVNLNQVRGGDPAPYDPVSIKGFSFDVTGPGISQRLHFGVDAEESKAFCKPISSGDEPAGHHEILLDQLIEANCNKSPTTGPNFVAVSAKLVTLNWRVSGITTQAIPFDFCIENFRVLPN